MPVSEWVWYNEKYQIRSSEDSCKWKFPEKSFACPERNTGCSDTIEAGACPEMNTHVQTDTIEELKK